MTNPVAMIRGFVTGGRQIIARGSEMLSDRLRALERNVSNNVRYLTGNAACVTGGTSSAFNQGSGSEGGKAVRVANPQDDVSQVRALHIGSITTPVITAWKGEDEEKAEGTQYNQEANVTELEEVRKVIDNAISTWNRMRRFGLAESSWENKMPWLRPRPSYLAKGLHLPPEEFASEREKKLYYRRARSRRRFLLGPLPTWSFIAADFALLYFLINNPEAKFYL